MVMMDCDKCGHPYGFGCHCSDKGMSRADIVKRAQKIRAEIAQAFFDAERWNRLHPQEYAINPDPDGELERLANELDAMLETEGAQRKGKRLAVGESCFTAGLGGSINEERGDVWE